MKSVECLLLSIVTFSHSLFTERLNRHEVCPYRLLFVLQRYSLGLCSAHYSSVSSLTFPSVSLPLSFNSRHQIKGKTYQAFLSFSASFTQCGKCVRVCMIENCLHQTKPLLLTLRTPTLQGQTHSHTHYTHSAPDSPVGDICSLLRNNWHSEHEYTTGICPWFPCITAQA